MRACNNARLPGARVAFRVGVEQVGWLSPAVAAALAGFGAVSHASDVVTLNDPSILPDIAKALADQGLFRWRGEAFDVRAAPDGPVLAIIDRGALPSFGIQATGVHVNGLVEKVDGPYLWVARRAKDKLLDPGKLDHVVAGGVSSGLNSWETLLKEAGEEASIPPELAAEAIPVSKVSYSMERAEGLRRDWLHCYDLSLPIDFMPVALDGEVESFELWPVDRVFETVSKTDDFKFNVNLVLIDLFIRRGLIDSSDAEPLSNALKGANE